MAEGYQTEDEQVEALKKWWRENGKSTIASIVVAIVAVLGWQGWQKQQQAEIDTASGIYQNMLTAAQGVNGDVSAEQQATANHLAGTLKEDFAGSTYALFAAMYKAKFAVSENDLVTAEQELRWVLAKGPSSELAQQAELRLARVLYAQEKYDEALAQLQGEKIAPSAGAEELKGDIYQAQGDKDAAAIAYQKASELGAQGQSSLPNPLLEMKIQQLKSEQGGTAVNTAAEKSSSEGDA